MDPTEPLQPLDVTYGPFVLPMILGLRAWLDQQVITSDNIGEIRRQLIMPFDCRWNGIVRDETAQRENKRNG